MTTTTDKVQALRNEARKVREDCDNCDVCRCDCALCGCQTYRALKEINGRIRTLYAS